MSGLLNYWFYRWHCGLEDVLLTIVSIVWFAFFEQHSTALFWIGLDVDLPVLVVAGFGLASLHFLLSGSSIKKGRPLDWMRPVLFFAAGLIWVVLALNWADTGGQPEMLFYAVTILACLSHAAAIPSFVTLKIPTVQVTRVGLIFGFSITLTGLAALVFGELDEDFNIVFIALIAVIAIVSFFSLFFIRHVLSILRERDPSIRKSLDGARR